MDPEPGAFERATAVERVAPTGGETATYRAEVAEGWDILGNANGGYLLALAARMMTEPSGSTRSCLIDGALSVARTAGRTDR